MTKMQTTPTTKDATMTMRRKVADESWVANILNLCVGKSPNETQDQPPLVRASVACNGGVFIKGNEAVRRPAVGCIAWLDVSGFWRT